MTEYKSNIKEVKAPIVRVYNKLSNLENLKGVTDKLPSEFTEKVKMQIVNNDECLFDVGVMGKVTFKVVDREENKVIKFKAENSPIPLLMWIQVLSKNESTSCLRLTIHTELNFMIKKMVGNKLEKGINELASILAQIPY